MIPVTTCSKFGFHDRSSAGNGDVGKAKGGLVLTAGTVPSSYIPSRWPITPVVVLTIVVVISVYVIIA